MSRFPLVLATILLCAFPLLAQDNPGYKFDNFDTVAGVKVRNISTTATLPRSKTVRLTSKALKTGNRTSYKPVEALYVPTGTGMTSAKSLDGFTTGNRQIDGFIVDAGVRNRVDPVLLYAIMHQESTFKQRAISPKGARGLMQLMPRTAARFGVNNIFDPRQNIEGGARYMRFLLDTFNGDVSLALAGYNAGEGAVFKYGRVPPYSETLEYVRRIAGRYSLMRDPSIARNAHRISPAQLAEVRENEKAQPLSVYERNVFAVRLPDGRLQLLSR